MFKNKRKRFFTLIEIVIVLVIIAIMATLMIPVYFNLIEKSKNTACETNERVLLGALEMYGAEHTVLPASLSQLRDKDIQRSWAKILSKPGSWKIRLAYAVVNFDARQLAYATESWLQEYLGLVKGPACPNDLTPPPLSSSYGINQDLSGQPSSELINADMDMAIIADSDTETFVYPIPRHTKHSLLGASDFAIAISRSNEIIYVPETPPPPVPNAFYTMDNNGGTTAVPMLSGDNKSRCKRFCGSTLRQSCRYNDKDIDHCKELVHNCREICEHH